MRRSILLLALAAIALTSCSTRYKTGQTPDDVYYAPTAKVNEAVVKNDKDKDDDKDKYEDYTSSQEDRYLRMKVRNRYRWSAIDDWNYWNDTRYYGTDYYGIYYPTSYGGVIYNPGWYNPVFSVGYNNHCCCYSNSPHNPYYGGYIIKNPVVRAGTVKPNLNTYSNNNYNNNNQQGFIKKVFGSGKKYNNNNNDNASSSGRSYTPSSSSSSSSSSGSSSSSSGSGVSRPGRN